VPIERPYATYTIGLRLQLCDYLLSFPRYNDLLIENLNFHRFTHPSLV